MNIVKITSGNYRGRAIKTPKSDKTHPMGSREKMALFNMICDYLPNAKVLDAFAGSGALGIEAISRGAKEAVFLEKSIAACNVIRENLKSLEINAKIYQIDVVNFTTSDRFDVIIADPPYHDFKVEEVTHLVHLLQTDGILVLSHPGNAPILPDMKCIKSRNYAAANISVYRNL